MRILNGVLCMILVAFAAVQLNDPDAMLWIAIYLGGAFWCGVAAARPDALARGAVRALLGLSLAAAVAGVVVWWPDTGEWWRREVWWTDEGAREGMGMMIVVVVLLVVGVAAMRARRRRR